VHAMGKYLFRILAISKRLTLSMRKATQTVLIVVKIVYPRGMSTQTKHDRLN